MGLPETISASVSSKVLLGGLVWGFLGFFGFLFVCLFVFSFFMRLGSRLFLKADFQA